MGLKRTSSKVDIKGEHMMLIDPKFYTIDCLRLFWTVLGVMDTFFVIFPLNTIGKLYIKISKKSFKGL